MYVISPSMTLQAVVLSVLAVSVIALCLGIWTRLPGEDVEDQPNLIKLSMYSDPSLDADMVKSDLKKRLTEANIGIISIDTHILDESTWLNSWQQYIEPTCTGCRAFFCIAALQARFFKSSVRLRKVWPWLPVTVSAWSRLLRTLSSTHSATARNKGLMASSWSRVMGSRAFSE